MSRSNKNTELYFNVLNSIKKSPKSINDAATDLGLSVGGIRHQVALLHKDHRIYVADWKVSGVNVTRIFGAGNFPDVQKPKRIVATRTEKRRLAALRARSPVPLSAIGVPMPRIGIWGL